VPSAAPSRQASAPPYRVVGSLEDTRGDQGLEGPAYADLRAVTVEDDGTHARVTVALSAALPLRAKDRESLGIGVDVYRTVTQGESDYQLFADGGPDGWFAYLQTPKGFVRYPGSFALSGTRMVFTLPWSSLGGRRTGRFSAFADWTQGGRPGTLGGNASSQDLAPAVGSTAYGR
jgi:hypothetical protein